jgi:hypothetical protein
MESVEYRERPQRWGLITAWPATRVMRGGDLGMVDIILGSWQFPVLSLNENYMSLRGGKP